MRRILPTLISLVVLAGLIKLVRVVQQYDPALERGSDIVPDVSIQLKDAVIIARKLGKPEWTMEAANIDVHPQGVGSLDSFRSAEFKDIRNGVLYRDGREEAKFSATAGTFDQSTQQFAIEGGMRISNRAGDRVEAEQATWSEKDDFVRMPKGARGIFNGNRVAAPFLLFSPKKRIVQCPQGAEGTFDGYPLHAAGIVWNVNDAQVQCTGPVSGERHGIAYNGESALLDLKDRKLRVNRGTFEFRIGSGEDLEGLH